METTAYVYIPLKTFMASLLLIVLTFSAAASARILDEDEAAVPAVAPQDPDPVEAPVSAVTRAVPNVMPETTSDPNHTFSFFMHDILGGTNPSARAVTGIVVNPSVNGQLPFAKPNGANIPINNGIPSNNGNSGLTNNNIPFLTGLGGVSSNFVRNNGNNAINGMNGMQLPSGTTLQKLMFGTMTVIDDELTEGHELGSGFVGKAQGFYVVSAEDGSSQTMAFTAMFQDGNYVDSLNFFGLHRTAVSESQLGIMGGTGKYVNAKGYATVKTFPNANQHSTDGVETLLEITVYLV